MSLMSLIFFNWLLQCPCVGGREIYIKWVGGVLRGDCLTMMYEDRKINCSSISLYWTEECGFSGALLSNTGPEILQK